MNRPIATAKMAATGGADGDKAKAFSAANPVLKNTLDVGKLGGKPDGNITNGDDKSFARKKEKSQDTASNDIDKYQKDPTRNRCTLWPRPPYFGLTSCCCQNNP